MEKVKAYTDLEQSKKLVEILPIKSADMYYKYVLPKSDRIIHTPEIGNPIDSLKWYNEGYTFSGKREPITLNEYCIPCWSLATLLQLLPLGIYDISDDCDYELEINMIDKMPRYVRFGEMYHSQFPYDFEKDTLLDNIVESIIWLNNNNYLEL